MPLYEYSCDKCEHTFEELVHNGEAVECPECHGRHVERLLSLPARRKPGQFEYDVSAPRGLRKAAPKMSAS